MNTYKGITFAKGYNKPFAEFKEEFGSTHIFNNIHPSKREQELKIAHKIAIENRITRDDILTQKIIKEIEVIKTEILKPDGNTSGATDEGKKITTK